MTTRGSGGRSAVTHYEVRERIASQYGKFALVDVRIETGRSHQIRVHLSSLGYPIVGDALYGAPREIRLSTAARPQTMAAVLSLDRNFLHATAIGFRLPSTGDWLDLEAPLPQELVDVLEVLRTENDSSHSLQ